MIIANRPKRTPVSKPVEEFLKLRSGKVADEYHGRLLFFDRFCESLGGTESVIERLKVPDGKSKSELNPYLLLAQYKNYLAESNKRNNKRPIKARTIKWRVTTAKTMIEVMADLTIDDDKLRNYVSYGHLDEREPYSLTRDEIIKLLITPFNRRLTVFLHFLLVCGARPIEACRLKVSNLNLDSNPPRVNFPASITKIRKERTNYLTGELATVLKSWLNYKYRERNYTIFLKDKKKDGPKTKTIKFTPVRKDDDLLFAMNGEDKNNEGSIIEDDKVTPNSIYDGLANNLRTLLDDIGLDGKYEDGVRKVGFSSCRDYVKTQISDAGYEKFSEYWIGHKQLYNYWTHGGKRLTDETARIDIFHKIEHLLTYLDKDRVQEIQQDNISRLEAQKKQINKLTEEKEDMRERLEHLEQLIMYRPDNIEGTDPNIIFKKSRIDQVKLFENIYNDAKKRNDKKQMDFAEQNILRIKNILARL